jgi:hypothetical protein
MPGNEDEAVALAEAPRMSWGGRVLARFEYGDASLRAVQAGPPRAAPYSIDVPLPTERRRPRTSPSCSRRREPEPAGDVLGGDPDRPIVARDGGGVVAPPATPSPPNASYPEMSSGSRGRVDREGRVDGLDHPAIPDAEALVRWNVAGLVAVVGVAVILERDAREAESPGIRGRDRRRLPGDDPGRVRLARRVRNIAVDLLTRLGQPVARRI